MFSVVSEEFSVSIFVVEGSVMKLETTRSSRNVGKLMQNTTPHLRGQVSSDMEDIISVATLVFS